MKNIHETLNQPTAPAPLSSNGIGGEGRGEEALLKIDGYTKLRPVAILGHIDRGRLTEIV